MSSNFVDSVEHEKSSQFTQMAFQSQNSQDPEEYPAKTIPSDEMTSSPFGMGLPSQIIKFNRVIDQKCTLHPSRKAKYTDTCPANEKPRLYCSECAVDFAQNGRKLAKIKKTLSPTASFSIEDTRNEAKSLSDAFRKAISQINSSISVLQNHYSSQIEKVNFDFMLLEKVLIDERNDLIAFLNKSLYQAVSALETKKDQLSADLGESDGIEAQMSPSASPSNKMPGTQDVFVGHRERLKQLQKKLKKSLSRQYSCIKVSENNGAVQALRKMMPEYIVVKEEILSIENITEENLGSDESDFFTNILAAENYKNLLKAQNEGFLTRQMPLEPPAMSPFSPDRRIFVCNVNGDYDEIKPSFSTYLPSNAKNTNFSTTILEEHKNDNSDDCKSTDLNKFFQKKHVQSCLDKPVSNSYLEPPSAQKFGRFNKVEHEDHDFSPFIYRYSVENTPQNPQNESSSHILESTDPMASLRQSLDPINTTSKSLSQNNIEKRPQKAKNKLQIEITKSPCIDNFEKNRMASTVLLQSKKQGGSPNVMTPEHEQTSSSLFKRTTEASRIRGTQNMSHFGQHSGASGAYYPKSSCNSTKSSNLNQLATMRNPAAHKESSNVYLSLLSPSRIGNKSGAQNQNKSELSAGKEDFTRKGSMKGHLSSMHLINSSSFEVPKTGQGSQTLRTKQIQSPSGHNSLRASSSSSKQKFVSKDTLTKRLKEDKTSKVYSPAGPNKSAKINDQGDLPEGRRRGSSLTKLREYGYQQGGSSNARQTAERFWTSREKQWTGKTDETCGTNKS